MPRDRLFRTNKHLHATVGEKDLHTGLSLWRKFAAIKNFYDVYNSMSPCRSLTLALLCCITHFT